MKGVVWLLLQLYIEFVAFSSDNPETDFTFLRVSSLCLLYSLLYALYYTTHIPIRHTNRQIQTQIYVCMYKRKSVTSITTTYKNISLQKCDIIFEFALFYDSFFLVVKSDVTFLFRKFSKKESIPI